MILTKQNEIVQTHSRVPIRVGSTIQLHYEVSPNYSDLSRKYGQAPVVSNDRRNSEIGWVQYTKYLICEGCWDNA